MKMSTAVFVLMYMLAICVVSLVYQYKQESSTRRAKVYYATNANENSEEAMKFIGEEL